VDIEAIIKNVAEVVKETPSARSTVKAGKDIEKRYYALAKYMVKKAIKHDALIVSKNGDGIAILFEHKKEIKNQFKDSLFQQIELLFQVTGIKNAFQIVKNQKTVNAQRPEDEDHLYCWFWGIAKSSRGAEAQTASEMKDTLLRIAEERRLPLYAETRTKRNVIVYRRYGFEMFHEWTHPDGDKMWFLRYLPKSLETK